MKMRSSNSGWIKNILVLAFYVVLVFVFNWSILLRKNVMKWDIMDAYYPLCMFSADMLRSGKLPLWNAALQFGTPAYVMLGIPYWYPTTLLFEVTTGYSLICVAIDYCFHIVLACFGMFLLIKSHLNDTKNKFIISIMGGSIYGFSGLFVSNAEHIMIIVSAAWIPFILYFVKKYCKTQSKVFIMFAAMCMGLSILGGYPEVWVDTLIILIPWFLIYTNSDGTKVKWVIRAAYSYTVMVLAAFASAGISVIPFAMSSQYIERLKGGVSVNSWNWKMILSTFLPHYTELSSEIGGTLDISMISVFMGMLTILLFASSFFIRVTYKWKYLGICFFCFLMMLGSNAFLHPLFYKYFPMFSTLRFPSLWRCIFVTFVLLLSAEALERILVDEKMLKFVSVLCILASMASLGGYRLLAEFTEKISLTVINGFQKDLKSDTVIFFAYAVVFFSIYFVQKRKNLNISYILIGIMIADIFANQYCLHPLTVTAYNQWDFGQIKDAQYTIQELFANDKNRTHSIEYKDAKRTKSGLDSRNIVLGHTLDEEGYLSVLLNYVRKYRSSVHCAVSSETPAVYFTNDVVNNMNINYDEWIQDENISPYQIFVEKDLGSTKLDGDLYEEVEPQEFISGKIVIDVHQISEGCLVVQQSFYPGWHAYVDGKKAELIEVNGTFLGVWLDEGEHRVELIFRPWDFYIGAFISFIYFVFLCRELFVHLSVKRENLKNTGL